MSTLSVQNEQQEDLIISDTFPTLPLVRFSRSSDRTTFFISRRLVNGSITCISRRVFETRRHLTKMQHCLSRVQSCVSKRASPSKNRLNRSHEKPDKKDNWKC